ncbi:MAG: hypothetical protein K8F24_05690, partial [Bacteroidales bacterium]|nr:hypothetical protein [Bacteroidales bacterium]
VKKHKVTICTGTLCHVMGGSELPALSQFIPPQYLNQVEIKGSPCINHCKDKDLKPPFAEIDGDIFSEATIDKLVKELIKRIENDSKQ